MKNASTITLRLDKSDQKAIEHLKSIIWAKTSSGAYKHAVHEYPAMMEENTRLEHRIAELEFQLEDSQKLMESVRTQCALILDKTGQTSLV